jgi:hypothetical protein
VAAIDNGGPKRFCDCAETLVSGVRQPCGRWHNCQYVTERSKLISKAEARAAEIVSDPPDDPDERNQHGYKFTAAFNREMEKLAAPLLRQSGNGAHEQKAA